MKRKLIIGILVPVIIALGNVEIFANSNMGFYIQDDAIQNKGVVAPRFKGGEQALMKFISDSISYPEVAKKYGVQGKVYITFSVDDNGNVKDAKILRGIGAGCDEEALRTVIKTSGHWETCKWKNCHGHNTYKIYCDSNI